MSSNPPQGVNVSCPACGTAYIVPVQNVIDVGRSPRLKTMLLQGRLNVGTCPRCGTGSLLAMPMVYHDPAKELLLVLIPQEMQIRENERQRIIGEMSNSVINSLPAEQRRGYLLRPRVFLTFQSMIEAILEADGITREMLEAQQERARIINVMLEAQDDSLRLAELIGQYADKIDYDLFAVLSANIELAEQAAQTESAERLVRLRFSLLEQTDIGREIAEREQALEKAIAGIDERLTREELLNRILALGGEDKESILSVLLALGRPLIDYQFFQLMTQRIEQAEQQGNAQEAEHIRSVRGRVLGLTQQLDAELREHMQHKAEVLAQIASSPDKKAAVATNLEEIDSVFLSVLEANIVQNEQMGRPEMAEVLRAVRNAIVEVLEESAPPEIRLIGQLLEAAYPDETRQILADNQAMVTQEFVRLMELVIRDLADRGDEQKSRQLQGIRAQARLMVGS